MKRNVNHKNLEYFPLSMFKERPQDFASHKYEIRNHVGKPKSKIVKKRDDLKLPEDCLLHYGKKSKPIMNVCITMYNEPFKQLLESLAGTYRAYYEMVGINEKFKDRVHIFIIVDGYDKIDEDFLIRCEKAGIYNEFKTKRFRTVETPPGSNEPKHVFRDLRFINKDTMNDKHRIYGTNNIAHCFSRSVKFPEFMNGLTEEEANNFEIDRYSIYDFLLGSDKVGKVKEKKFFHLPIPTHFVIKHKNQGKIESHKWFFKGFCEYMEPKYAQIIDCGSIPLWNSISYIVMHLETVNMVGGACGEIECILSEKKEDGAGVSFIESVLLRAQYVEYKLSHYLDKATETFFGFVSVLPGAFSIFRWECINGRPLDEFLKGAKDEFGDMTKIMKCRDANKYLAEDRIMCLEIIAKEGCDFIIHYIPGAKCLTDPPLSLTQLIKQRRRWFNGSLFASIHVLKHMCKIWGRKGSSWIRNFAFMLLYLYMIVQMLLSFVLVGSFYAVFSVFIRAVLPSDDCLSITSAANVIENIYLLFIGLVLMLSTTIEIQWAEGGFRLVSLFMGAFTVLMVVSSILYALGERIDSIAVIFLISFIASYALPLFMNISKLKFCDFVKGVMYVVYLSPTYVNIFTIYAISNIHDVSWGSRPTVVTNDSMKQTEKKKDMRYKNYRSQFLVFWAICNLAFAYGFISLWDGGNEQIIFYVGSFLVAVNLFKITISILHMFKARYDKWKVHKKIATKSSTIFKDVDKMNESEKEDVFVVYYEDEGGYNIRISTKDDPQYRKSDIKSSILGDKIYRGFSVADLNKAHRISQGLSINNIRGTNGFKRQGTTMVWMDDDSSDSISDDGDQLSSLTDRNVLQSKDTGDLPGISMSNKKNKKRVKFDESATKIPKKYVRKENHKSSDDDDDDDEDDDEETPPSDTSSTHNNQNEEEADEEEEDESDEDSSDSDDDIEKRRGHKGHMVRVNGITG